MCNYSFAKCRKAVLPAGRIRLCRCQRSILRAARLQAAGSRAALKRLVDSSTGTQVLILYALGVHTWGPNPQSSSLHCLKVPRAAKASAQRQTTARLESAVTNRSCSEILPKPRSRIKASCSYRPSSRKRLELEHPLSHEQAYMDMIPAMFLN